MAQPFVGYLKPKHMNLHLSWKVKTGPVSPFSEKVNIGPFYTQVKMFIIDLNRINWSGVSLTQKVNIGPF